MVSKKKEKTILKMVRERIEQLVKLPKIGRHQIPLPKPGIFIEIIETEK